MSTRTCRRTQVIACVSFPVSPAPTQELKNMEELRDRPNPENDVVFEDNDEDLSPMLSSETLSALKEFLAEQNRSLNVDREVETEGKLEEKAKEVALLSEDWRLSQFWYDRETAETVAQEVLALCEASDCRVACIACPTLYAYLKVFGILFFFFFPFEVLVFCLYFAEKIGRSSSFYIFLYVFFMLIVGELLSWGAIKKNVRFCGVNL